MLNEPIKATFKDAATKLTGHLKRDFMAKVAEDYFGGSARKAETVLGWNRRAVQLGSNSKFGTSLRCFSRSSPIEET